MGVSLIMGLFRGSGWRTSLAAGFFAQIVAGGLNEVTHRLPELEDSALHFTAHAMFTLGLLASSLTIFSAVCIGMIHSEVVSTVLQLGQLTSGVALWLTASGSILYIFDTTPAATVLLGFTAATILGSAVYSSPRAYSGTLTWTIYAASIYLFTVGYAGGPPYMPIGFTATLVADLTKGKDAGRKYTRLAIMALLGMTAHIAYPTYMNGVFQILGLLLGGLIGGILLTYVGERVASDSRSSSASHLRTHYL